MYDHLSKRFGIANTFKDVDSLPVGVKFTEKIVSTITECDVFIAVIGKDWLITNSSGKMRLFEPEDVVRLEVETALKHRIRIIPVLVQNAEMPAPTLLPDSLKPLCSINAAIVRSGRDFRNDVETLSQAISKQRYPRLTRRLILASTCFLLLPIGFFALRHTGASMTIDDVIVEQRQNHVELDIRIRNQGKSVVNVSRACIHILQREAAMSAYAPSAEYDLQIADTENVVAIAHQLKPGEVDRFILKLGFSEYNTSCFFRAKLFLTYNRDKQAVSDPFNMTSLSIVNSSTKTEQRNARELRVARFLMVSHLAATA